jgi:hypothetical protein
MVDRREMLKVTVVGVAGLAAASGMFAGGRQAPRGQALRFKVYGDMGTIRARAAVDTVRVSGEFAEATTFTLR